MNTEIAEKIKNMLVENLRIPADELEYTSELFGDDIGLDSIDSIEIIAGIDNLFGVQMTGAARENFQTIETLTKYVEEHIGEDSERQKDRCNRSGTYLRARRRHRQVLERGFKRYHRYPRGTVGEHRGLLRKQGRRGS